jgi:hypothetical protein
MRGKDAAFCNRSGAALANGTAQASRMIPKKIFRSRLVTRVIRRRTSGLLQIEILGAKNAGLLGFRPKSPFGCRLKAPEISARQKEILTYALVFERFCALRNLSGPPKLKYFKQEV